jgi:hypothetical protein
MNKLLLPTQRLKRYTIHKIQTVTVGKKEADIAGADILISCQKQNKTMVRWGEENGSSSD